jgi:hypothetical protein
MSFEASDLHQWVRCAVASKASRRQFVRAMAGLGLSVPSIANLLAACRPAAAQGVRPAPQAAVGDCASYGGRRQPFSTLT